MKSFRFWIIAVKAYLIFSFLGIFSFSLLALFDPQMIMDLVSVNLPNNDAISSLRGVYGGVGITICLSVLYLYFLHPIKGAAFLSVFWGAYGFSRLITLFSEGPLGDFGNFCFLVEAILSIFGLIFWHFSNSSRRNQKFILPSKI